MGSSYFIQAAGPSTTRHQAAQGHRGEQKEESMGKTCTLTKRAKSGLGSVR